MAIGRVSGQLLKSNLLRSGVNLAFETDLLYLDVVNSRIGVNKGTPTSAGGLAQYDLDVYGTTRTTDLIVDNQLDIGNLTVTGNTISSTQNTISFAPSGGEPTIYHSRLQVNDIQLEDNVISTLSSNSNLEIRPSGTGTLDVYADTNITGNLNVTGNIDVTGNITIKGNITIGDALSDTIVINAAIKSSLIPETDNTYDLGSTAFKWKTAYARNIFASTLNTNAMNVGNITLNNNVISTTTNTDLIIDPNGTGRVILGNFSIIGNTITNIANNAITNLVQTGVSGYFRITGTNGFRPPVGNVAQRPTAYMSPSTVGMTRYNTDSRALEIWDGVTWASPAGSSGAVSALQAEDIAIRTVLTFG